jgi:hypothetical protein
MKRDSGITDRDDRSSGIEIRITEDLAKINPTDPLILGKQNTRRNRNCSDSSGNSLGRVEASWWVCRNSRRLKIVINTTSRVYCNWHESYGFGAINVQLSIVATIVDSGESLPSPPQRVVPKICVFFSPFFRQL